MKKEVLNKIKTVKRAARHKEESQEDRFRKKK